MLTEGFHGHSLGNSPRPYLGNRGWVCPSRGQVEKLARPRVLVVEYRDEVYAGLKTLLDDKGCEVARTELGTTVVEALRRFAPDLILINQDMPDESGWLITSKLRLALYRKPVWLYAARHLHSDSAWKRMSGADELIAYDGVLVRLLQPIRQNIAAWLAGTAGFRD